MVSLGVDGSVKSWRSLSKPAPWSNQPVSEPFEEPFDDTTTNLEEQKFNSTAQDLNGLSDTKLIKAEEILEGHISWKALRLFFAGLGGDHPILFWTIFLGGFGITAVVNAASTWWLGYWASKYISAESSQVNVP